METTEQKIESAMRMLLDLKGDIGLQVSRVGRMVRHRYSEPALAQCLGNIQVELGQAVDGHACRRLARLLVEKVYQA